MTSVASAPYQYSCDPNKVKVLQVGDEETSVSSPRTRTPDERLPRRCRRKQNSRLSEDLTVDKGYLRKISEGLSFSEDVVKDRCRHTLPYDLKYFYEALDASNVVSHSPFARSNTLGGRHNPRGSEQKHLPCHIKKRAAHKLKPIKRPIQDRAREMHQLALQAQEKEENTRITTEESSQECSTFLTEAETEQDQPQPESYRWDDYLMSIMSEATSRWIVHNRLSPGEQQEKLKSLLNTYHGPIEDTEVELVQDRMSDSEMTDRSNFRRKSSRKLKQADLFLEKVKDKQKSLHQDSDSEEEGEVAFYRLPAVVRRERKNRAREEAGTINSTAHGLEVVRFDVPPPTTMKEFLNPKVGDKFYDAENLFQRERLTGGQQIHMKSGDSKEKIFMDSTNTYTKSLQPGVPQSSEVWCPTQSDSKTRLQSAKRAPKLTTHEKGPRRWKALPELVDNTMELMNKTMPGMDDRSCRTPEFGFSKEVSDNATLVQIVKDWRMKWNLDMRYADATIEDLIRDMGSMHTQVRLTAITTCARAAEYKPPPEPGIPVGQRHKQGQHVKLLPEELFIALRCCLDDRHDQVRRAAAIALYTLERPNDKAEALLRETLVNGNWADRWAAAQCLAFYGECDSEVVGELMYMLLNTDDGIMHERAGSLMTKLSQNSTLVHSMLAEQLNSQNWQHRLLACKILPKLRGQINKDLTNKLIHLMWNDWSANVRKAAAQTLGKTGRGRDVHDKLIEKIQSGDEMERIDAISRVGYLGIMTAKLLPSFLECFSDDHSLVRVEICRACMNLKITDPDVIAKLLFLATFDPIWKVKALAIQTFGVIGVTRPDIRECILWALRYEDQAGVRAEACHTVKVLGYRDNEVVQILQDRLLVEANKVVREEITQTLNSIGISSTQEELDMVLQIKDEVRKLSTRNNISTQIYIQDKEESTQKNIARLIYHEDADEEKMRASVASRLAEVRSRLTHRSVSKQRTCSPDALSSREGTSLTPGADREIRDVLSRPDLTDSESRSLRTIESEDADELRLSETDTQSIATFHSKSAMSRISEESEEDLLRSRKADVFAKIGDIKVTSDDDGDDAQGSGSAAEETTNSRVRGSLNGCTEVTNAPVPVAEARKSLANNSDDIMMGDLNADSNARPQSLGGTSQRSLQGVAGAIHPHSGDTEHSPSMLLATQTPSLLRPSGGAADISETSQGHRAVSQEQSA